MILKETTLPIRDLTNSNVVLSGDADKKCKQIKEAIPSSQLSRPQPYIINKLICDYTKEHAMTEEIHLRLFYLWLNLKHQSVWNKGISIKTSFNSEASRAIVSFQNFARSKRFVIDKREIPNVIIHDYIAILQIRKIDIVQHYLTLHP